MKYTIRLLFYFLIFFTPYSSIGQDLYFPPLIGEEWESKTPEDLNWCVERLDSINKFLIENNSKAFIILKDGKIVIEEYFGGFGRDSLWYWASAGKSLTSMLVGIAQEKGLLDINHKTSDYLGENWTSLTSEQENKIKIYHQLSMTSGIVGYWDNNCLSADCLKYEALAGSIWRYNNAPYRLLQDVVENASGISFQQFTNQNLSIKTGILGLWYDYVFYSTPRSMARFGLLALNKGKWKNTSVLSDLNYMSSSINSSQDLNPSYGYLWWLNGKTSFMLPGINFSFNGNIIPNGPDDMICALGKNDQKIYIVPSNNLVVVRMGEASGEIVGAISSFDNQLWGLLNQLFCEITPVSDIRKEEIDIKYLNNIIENISDKSVSILLINIDGIILGNFELSPYSKIDLSSNPIGVYYIHYVNSRNQIINLKIIKN